MQAPGQNGIRWFELDFKEVTQRKAAILAGHEPLRKLLGPEDQQTIQLGEFTNAPGFVHAQPIAVFAFNTPFKSRLVKMPSCTAASHLLPSGSQKCVHTHIRAPVH